MQDTVKQAIADELNFDPLDLTPDKRLVELESWDSVTLLSVMVILSEALGREIAPEEMMGLTTYGDIEAMVAAGSI